jgi:glycine/D-amino acid oxidase-like deaminating enzyme
VELGYLKSAHSTTEDSVAFNVQPRKTGQLLIGSSRQFGAEHAAIDHHMLARMLRRAQEYMPGLADLSAIRTWTGFRAATPDKLPLIGPCPGDERCIWPRVTKGWELRRRWRRGSWSRTRYLRRTPAIPCGALLAGTQAGDACLIGCCSRWTG